MSASTVRSDLASGPVHTQISSAGDADAGGSRAVLESVAATVLAGAAYFGLRGELPYHDAPRFIGQVAGPPIWDIGHGLLQPTAVMLQRLTHAAPVTVLKDLSCVAVAVAIGLFYFLLTRLGTTRWTRIWGTLLLAGCCSVLTLAPSAHPKLVAFPFIVAALLCLCEAERDSGYGTKHGALSGLELLLAGGMLLGIGGAYLASALATGPFVTIAVLLTARARGYGVGAAMTRAGLATAAWSITFLAIVAVSYPVFSGLPLTVHGVLASVSEKTSVMTVPASPLVQTARAVFGTANNLVTVEGVGATIQAWLRGQIPSLRDYADLLPALAVWTTCALVIAAVYLRTAVVAVRQRALSIPMAFLCGAQAWSAWYGLNDPEHWFQLSAPTIVLLVTLMPKPIVRWAFPVWAGSVVTLNLLLLAGPVAAYPLSRHEAALDAIVRPNDLLISFAAYPGRPYVGFFKLDANRKMRPDVMLRAPGTTVAGVLAEIDADIARVLRQGGRVLVADALDPRDWEAPWMSLLGMGVTKPRLEAALLQGRTATRLQDLGGIKLWELRARDEPALVTPN